MTTPEQYRSHATFLSEMAQKSREDAAGDVSEYWRDKWLKDAARYAEDAAWYDQHAAMFEEEDE